MRMAILGAGESGTGAAVLAQSKGYDVFVSDSGQIGDTYKVILDQYGIAWEEGGHTEERILLADELVKSPGISPATPIVAAAIAQGIPILSEIELAARYSKAHMVAITGSNGKTTTTSLIHHLLTTAGIKAALAGNIGRSMAMQVASGEEPDWYVIELSSFQLENMYRFKADVAVLLNITPDHLDRYDFEMQGYVDAKMRITQNQTENDYFIYWLDDQYISTELTRTSSCGKRIAFADTPGAGAQIYVAYGQMKLTAPLSFSMPIADLALSGRHNVRNSMAAAAAALAVGASREAVRHGLASFHGVAHRLEKAGTFGGVHFVNDSKATNVDACFYALDAMTTPVVLIVGGTDKGNDYTPLLPLIMKKCRALVYLGADNAKLHHSFDQLGLPVADTHSMADCVAACRKLAREGDTVLLSPCCASFDLFRNMADRGNQFKELVKTTAH